MPKDSQDQQNLSNQQDQATTDAPASVNPQDVPQGTEVTTEKQSVVREDPEDQDA